MSSSITSEQSAATDYLQYLVRFQNTGTDIAFNVVIIDSLDSRLDLQSFEILNSSHNFTLTSSQGKLRWKIDDILLPDNNTNKAASNGFVD